MYGEIQSYGGYPQLFFRIDNQEVGDRISNWLSELGFITSKSGRTFWRLPHRVKYIRVDLREKRYRYSSCVKTSVILHKISKVPVSKTITKDELIQELVGTALL